MEHFLPLWSPFKLSSNSPDTTFFFPSCASEQNLSSYFLNIFFSLLLSYFCSLNLFLAQNAWQRDLEVLLLPFVRFAFSIYFFSSSFIQNSVELQSLLGNLEQFIESGQMAWNRKSVCQAEGSTGQLDKRFAQYRHLGNGGWLESILDWKASVAWEQRPHREEDNGESYEGSRRDHWGHAANHWWTGRTALLVQVKEDNRGQLTPL